MRPPQHPEIRTNAATPRVVRDSGDRRSGGKGRPASLQRGLPARVSGTRTRWEHLLAIPLVLALTAGGCAGGGISGESGFPLPTTAATPGAEDPDPGVPVPATGAGESSGTAGTLRQDDVTLTLGRHPLQLKVTPLEEEVVRLLAPDTRDRLRALARTHRDPSGGGRGAVLFLVSFFSAEAGAVFMERELTLVVAGLRERPSAIHPVTPGWGSQRLGAMETQMAVYAFAAAVDFNQAWALEYDGVVNDEWVRVIPLLQREQARVRSGGVGGC
jgi:hypothetical protein